MFWNIGTTGFNYVLGEIKSCFPFIVLRPPPWEIGLRNRIKEIKRIQRVDKKDRKKEKICLFQSRIIWFFLTNNALHTYKKFQFIFKFCRIKYMTKLFINS